MVYLVALLRCPCRAVFEGCDYSNVIYVDVVYIVIVEAIKVQEDSVKTQNIGRALVESIDILT